MEIIEWKFFIHLLLTSDISPGLIFFRKRFLMGLCKGGGGELIHGQAFVLVIFKQLVSHKQENKHVF